MDLFEALWNIATVNVTDRLCIHSLSLLDERQSFTFGKSRFDISNRKCTKYMSSINTQLLILDVLVILCLFEDKINTVRNGLHGFYYYKFFFVRSWYV